MQHRLKNTGKHIYFVKEYNAGEFGIYDQDNTLWADCFESIEHAQDWYNKYVGYNKKLKEMNNDIFHSLDEEE